MWRNKLEQLVGLLEKIPQPQSFSSKTGVYEPYFILELRASNWEIIPHATYTRLDGSPGREVRLSLGVIDSSKVDISQKELDCLLFLESDATANNRSIFSYTQPVGFLLDWLSESRLVAKTQFRSEVQPIRVCPEKATINLRLKKGAIGYFLLASLIFPDNTILEIREPATVLTANPIFLLYQDTLYQVASALPAVFWHNYFRIQEQFEIPLDELNEFIRLYLPHILPVLDWNNLGEHISEKEFPLSEKLIIFNEWNNHLQIDVKFRYGANEFPAYPASDRSLATDRKRLCIVRREGEKEEQARRFLEENGLIYRSGHWHIASDYYSLDWMRLIAPKLQKAGFTLVNEEQLQRYRVHREKARLQIKVKAGTDWLNLNFNILIGQNTVEIPDLVKQLESGKPYLRLEDGSSIYFDQDIQERLKEISHFLELKNGQGEIRLPIAGITVLQELQPLSEVVRVDKRVRTLLEKYQQVKKIEAVPPPKELHGVLREYQAHGLNWLSFLHQFSFGGILADDMGLGKTVQVIALLLHLQEQQQLQHPALIVVPLTLIFNWHEEIQKFAPQLRVLRYTGNRQERIKHLKKISRYDVVLCSYGVALQDQKKLAGVKFDYLILDESQKVKNPQTKTYKAISKLEARHKLALTGTPVENSLQDLWAQINIVNPGLLGSLKDFQKRYMDPNGEDPALRRQTLKKIVYPFILRRTKEEVETQLPPLTEIVQYVEMTDSQRDIYQKWLAFYRGEILSRVDQAGMNKNRLKIVEALTYLRQIACHPSILNHDVELLDSGKTQLLADMLEDLLGKGHKILIFSQFVRFLTLVRKIFDERGWRYEYLDGKVRNRAERIHNFQENPDISAFLISLKAGGLGLNLTAADYVIHLDPWWNPAVEQQATDRAHRIGQEKRVFVYKFVLKGSVEEKIIKMQQVKRELSEEIITSDTGFVKQLTRQDLETLFEDRLP